MENLAQAILSLFHKDENHIANLKHAPQISWNEKDGIIMG